MGRALNKTLLASSVLLALASQSAFATNGLAPTGVGMEQRAMGGAAVANASNTMSMGTNPASAAFINDGYDIGIELFKPNRYATTNAGAGAIGLASGVEFDGNDEDMFLVPEGGYKRKINDKVDVGVVAYGSGGMNTSYKIDPYNGTLPSLMNPPGPPPFATVTGGGKPTGVDFKQLFVSPTVSYKVNENNAVGISANIVYQEFKARADGFGLDAANAYPTNSKSGAGVTVGWQGKLSPQLSAGASYRSKVHMGTFDDYSSFGNMDVPAATTVGVAYQATPKTLVVADVQKIDYSKVEAIGDNFGWDDQTVYKVGVKHQVNDQLAVLAGVNHGKSPLGADATTFGVLAPAVVEDHVSLGFEKKVSPKAKIIGSYVHAFENTVKGDPAQMGLYDLKMDQDAVGVAYSVEF